MSQIVPLLNMVCQTLNIDLIVFNQDLHITYSSPHAAQVLELADSVDKTLYAGTDEKIRSHWPAIFRNVLLSGQKTEFRDLRYVNKGREYHLLVTCLPVSCDPRKGSQGGVLMIQNQSGFGDESQQAHAERLMAMGKIAGRVAHELNNPLDGILRYINLSLRVLDDGQTEKAKEYLQQSRAGLLRMIQVLSELLDFSRSTHLSYPKMPLDLLLSDAIKSLEHLLSGISVTIHRQFEGPAPVVRSDSLFQVFCNLIKNAAEAMGGHGALSISISRNPSAWTLHFHDSGPGFDPADTDKLFQPFYTTKPPGRGTGLGLAICKDIVEKFGGGISAVNAPEGGSIFTVTVPLSESPHPPAKEPDHE